MDDSSQTSPMEVTEETEKKSFKRKLTTDADGFIQPARVTKQRQAKIKALENNGIDTSNRFENLTDNESDRESIASEDPPHSTTKPAVKSVKYATKSPKPIYVSSSSFAGIRNSLTSLKVSKAPDFKIVGKQIKILAHTKDDKKMIQEKLSQTKQLHYSFTEPEDRHLQFVLYGHHTNDTEELKEELAASKIPASKVTKINRSTDSPIFLVSFEKKAEFNLIIRWARFQPNQRRPTQCHRCQRFGHAANNCALPFRCVKCLDAHEPGKCARTTRERAASCVNCQAEGHASNSTSCPAYQKHVEMIAAKKQKDIRVRQPREFPATRYVWSQHAVPTVASQPPPSTSNSQPVNRTNSEYRPVLTSQVSRLIPDPSNPFSQLSEIQEEFASIPNIDQTIALFASLVAELKAARNQSERLTVLIKYCGNKSLQSASQP
jgi:hypothetical protein